jgi:hypothetical protein
MPLRRLIFLSSLVVAVAAPSPGAALGASNATDRPLTGKSTATVTVDVATVTVTIDGTGQLSHLGKFTFHADQTFLAFTGGSAIFAGAETLVAANGDELFATATTTVTDTSATTSEATSVLTITGGTGRFAGASGTITRHEQGVLVSIVGSTRSNAITSTWEGRISY